MNSAGESSGGHSMPSGSDITNPDSNANVSITDESKGAIPKIKPVKVAKKMNNNLEDGFGLKRNGFKSFNSVYSDSSNSDTESPPKERTAYKRPSQEFSSEPYVPLYAPGFREEEIIGASYRDSSPKDTDDSTSSEDNDLSISDDGCFYTYKGDNVADLPPAFYRQIEIPPIEEPVVANRREDNSSPEMDFLEMDFDPGPSGDADSDSISNAEIDIADNLPLDIQSEAAVLQTTTSPKVPSPIEHFPFSAEFIKLPPKKCPYPISKGPEPCRALIPSYVPNILIWADPDPKSLPIMEDVSPSCHLYHKRPKEPWACSLAERTKSAKVLRTVQRHQGPKGELTSPLNDSSMLSELIQVLSDAESTQNDSEEKKKACSNNRLMIWSEEEAFAKQITQVGPSACGATAVLNVLNALGFPIPTVETVQSNVRTRQRANSAPLTEYLLSRSSSGCSHRELIRGIYELSNRAVYSRFFAMFPERVINLEMWLGYWISQGAVPIATINLQKCEGPLPDSWHHQMIFGVGPNCVYLTNPLECIEADQLWPQLCSEPVLLVKAEDVISRLNLERDFDQLTSIQDVRWSRLNVIGQVASVVRAHRRNSNAGRSHIRIPIEFTAGITLSVPMTSPAYPLLKQSPELPLLFSSAAASALNYD